MNLKKLRFGFLVGFVFFFSVESWSKTLIITDSHGEGAFGEELVSLLEKRGETLSAYAVGGSKADDWNHGLQQIWGYWEYHTGKPEIRSSKPMTPRLVNLLAVHHPDQVIIELGTNWIWSVIPDSAKSEIHSLIDAVKKTSAKCVWVGPPDLRPKPADRIQREFEIRELLFTQLQLEGCTLIESWNFTQYPATGGDGIHYDGIPAIGPGLARQWARGVGERLPFAFD